MKLLIAVFIAVSFYFFLWPFFNDIVNVVLATTGIYKLFDHLYERH